MALDVIPVINHLEDNLDGKPIIVILEIAPKKGGKRDYCSKKRKSTKKIKIRKHSDIESLKKLILANWATSQIRVSIN